ncbi:MAG: amino acid ABC transporter permease [Sulfitobacter sp.]
MIEFSNWDILRNLLLAARWTIALSVVAFIGGGIVGLCIMTMRISTKKYLQVISKGYIGLFQGTPLILQLFIIFFGMPMLGFRIDAWAAAALGLIFYASAFLAEIWRGGVQAVDKGQWDGSSALGLSWYQQMRLVILPQAIKYVRGPTVGFLVQLIKATAVTSIIGFEELVRVSGVINNATFEPLKVYGFVALIFFAICFPLTWYTRVLDRRASSD